MTNQYTSLVAAIPHPTVIIGEDERIVNANEAALEFFGKTIVGRNMMTAFRHPQLLSSIESCRRNRKASQIDFVMRSDIRDVSMRATVSSVQSEGAWVTMVFAEDVSHLMEAGKIRRDFVANVSHELRTPLTAILGYVETLQGPAKNDERARDRFLGTLEKEARRMTRLVHDLLSLSRVEQEERVRPHELTDLNAVVLSAIERVGATAEQANVTFQKNFEFEHLPIVGNPDQLGQIFTNLMENAVKYGGQDKTVTVKVAKTDYDKSLRGPSATVKIIDQGPGIAPFHIPRLTERFYRVDTHRSREMGGTGLGLAIVKHIVNRHRGRLKIDSIEGQGSCFAVTLPLP